MPRKNTEMSMTELTGDRPELPAYRTVRDLDQRLAMVMEARAAVIAAMTAIEEQVYTQEVNALIDGPAVDPTYAQKQFEEVACLDCIREALDAAALVLPQREDLDAFRPEWLKVNEFRNATATAIYNWVIELLHEDRPDNGPDYVDCFALAVAIGTPAADLWGMIRMALDDAEWRGYIFFADPGTSQ
jgi:hypothetical protein